MFDAIVSDVARGWYAPLPALMTGTLAALAVSGPFAMAWAVVGVAVGAGVAIGAVTVFTAIVQFVVTFWIAGRLGRRAGY